MAAADDYQGTTVSKRSKRFAACRILDPNSFRRSHLHDTLHVGDVVFISLGKYIQRRGEMSKKCRILMLERPRVRPFSVFAEVGSLSGTACTAGD
jgi:hypothetical protein